MCLSRVLVLRAECDGAIQVVISTGIVARSQSTFTETKQDVLLGFAQLSTLDLQTIQRSERLSIVLIRQEDTLHELEDLRAVAGVRELGDEGLSHADGLAEVRALGLVLQEDPIVQRILTYSLGSPRVLACTAKCQSSFARALELEAGITKEEEPLCTDSRAALRGSTQRTKRFFVASLSVEGSPEGIALLCCGLIVLQLL